MMVIGFHQASENNGCRKIYQRSEDEIDDAYHDKDRDCEQANEPTGLPLRALLLTEKVHVANLAHSEERATISFCRFIRQRLGSPAALKANYKPV